MRRRITYLVTSTLDLFAADILYNKLCWTEHVLRNLNNQLEDSHLRNRYREIRQLQWLLSDCKVAVGDYGLEVGAVKSGYLKQLLTKEYGGRIGLKEPFQKNQNEMVYDVAGGGSYNDTALYAASIHDKQRMQNLCSRLNSKINETECVQWLARIDQLGEKEDMSCTGSILELAETPPKRKHLDFEKHSA